ncbi:MAG: hypothetical protein RIS94_2788 [Pseudomonadota bacterium]|jgi:rare lipoprotein A
MRSAASLLALSAALALSSGAVLAKTPPSAANGVQFGPQGDYPVVVGDPFVIDGVTYTPADTMNYDAVGYAIPGAGTTISGAHRTLPLPCYVEVTALDSGHTILVRLDRRGPMAGGDRLVELSAAAWAQLGLSGDRVAVRVRRVNPPEQERLLLRTGQTAPARMDTPPGLLAALKRKLGIAPTPLAADEPTKTLPPAPTTRPAVIAPQPVGKPTAKPAPKPAPKPVVEAKANPAPAPKATPTPTAKPVARSGNAIQVAAFSTRDRAEKLAAQIGGRVIESGKFFRVRISTPTPAEEKAALAKARASGYAGARVVHGE